MIKELVAQRNLPPIPAERAEILRVLQEEIYGFLPPPPDEEWFETEAVDDRYPQADARRMRAFVRIGTRMFSFPFKTMLHRDGKKRPFFISANFRRDLPDMYMPSEEIIDNDFDLLSFCYEDVTSDDDDFTDGLADIFVGGSPRSGNTCGKICLWAWAAMRVMDYAESLPMLDRNNGAITGHSRLGKTALVTAMLDSRFRFVCSNNAGCGGDRIARGGNPGAETIADLINPRRFPYWFCENLNKYIDNTEQMPFDQHFLLAAIAPRYVCVGASSLDAWADPQSQYLTCVAASDYFEKQGVPGLLFPDRFPNPGEAFLDGNIGFQLKQGKHFFSRRDWGRYMEFIKKHL